MQNERKDEYERKRENLLERCKKCSSPTPEHCDYHCTTGRRLRMLEVEYSDVTGWSHEKWQK